MVFKRIELNMKTTEIKLRNKNVLYHHLGIIHIITQYAPLCGWTPYTENGNNKQAEKKCKDNEENLCCPLTGLDPCYH